MLTQLDQRMAVVKLAASHKFFLAGSLAADEELYM